MLELRPGNVFAILVVLPVVGLGLGTSGCTQRRSGNQEHRNFVMIRFMAYKALNKRCKLVISGGFFILPRRDAW